MRKGQPLGRDQFRRGGRGKGKERKKKKVGEWVYMGVVRSFFVWRKGNGGRERRGVGIEASKVKIEVGIIRPHL